MRSRLNREPRLALEIRAYQMEMRSRLNREPRLALERHQLPQRAVCRSAERRVERRQLQRPRVEIPVGQQRYSSEE